MGQSICPVRVSLRVQEDDLGANFRQGNNNSSFTSGRRAVEIAEVGATRRY
jgi:hypothetical protein